jgi:hypothetical protein
MPEADNQLEALVESEMEQYVIETAKQARLNSKLD